MLGTMQFYFGEICFGGSNFRWSPLYEFGDENIFTGMRFLSLVQTSISLSLSSSAFFVVVGDEDVVQMVERSIVCIDMILEFRGF